MPAPPSIATPDDLPTLASSRANHTVSRPVLIGEDWLAVLVGAALLALVLAGVRPGLPRFGWGTSASSAASLFGVGNLSRAFQVGVLVLVPLTVGASLLGAQLTRFVPGVVVLFTLAWLAQAAAGHAASAAWGLEYVLYGLAIGLLARPVLGRRGWVGEAVRTEYYIKAGLVVLGATVLFGEIVGAGLRGIVQALVVVLSVWTFCFWLAKRLRVDEELATMLASAVSICGVSAAIATCGAIQGDRKKLSYVTSLVLVVAMPMMVVMPWAARQMGLSDAVAGAWLGGTLDTSAAVVAAGELLGAVGRDTAVVVKLSQNALIGLAAFFLTIWWAMRRGSTDRPATSPRVIWERFPKFVFGFLMASLVFSFVLSPAEVAATRSIVNAIRTTLFAMAFVSIGLETSLGSLVTTGDGRPALAFVGGQAFNVAVTLAAAYLFFGLT